MMRKRILTRIFIFGMLGLGITKVYGSPLELIYDGNIHRYDLPPITLYIDDKRVETQAMAPVQIEQTTLVPIREVFEPMGASVVWREDEKKVYIAYQDTMMILEMSNPHILLNGNLLTLDVPAKTINNKIMVPVRFISEQLGFDVRWDGVTREINISSPTPKVPEIEEEPQQSKEDMLADLSAIHMSYESSKPKLSIAFQEQAILQQPIIKNDYVQKQITIDLGDRYEEHFKDGQVMIKDEVIDYIEVINDTTTQIILHMSSIYEEELERNEGSLDISFIKPKDKYDKILYLDAGHGGSAPGSMGNGLVEKEVNLKQTLAVKELIEKNTDIKVYLTRTEDIGVSVEERPLIANNVGADLFVSIHNNAVDDVEINGTEVFYYPDTTGNENKAIANLFQQKLMMHCNLKDRGAKPSLDLWVLKMSEMPAVLIEGGFLSNAQDAQLLGDEAFNTRYAYAVYEAIIETFEKLE